MKKWWIILSAIVVLIVAFGIVSQKKIQKDTTIPKEQGIENTAFENTNTRQVLEDSDTEQKDLSPSSMESDTELREQTPQSDDTSLTDDPDESTSKPFESGLEANEGELDP